MTLTYNGSHLFCQIISGISHRSTEIAQNVQINWIVLRFSNSKRYFLTQSWTQIKVHLHSMIRLILKKYGSHLKIYHGPNKIKLHVIDPNRSKNQDQKQLLTNEFCLLTHVQINLDWSQIVLDL